MLAPIDAEENFTSVRYFFKILFDIQFSLIKLAIGGAAFHIFFGNVFKIHFC